MNYFKVILYQRYYNYSYPHYTYSSDKYLSRYIDYVFMKKRKDKCYNY